MPRAIASSDEEDTEVLADVAHITSPKQASGDRPSRSRLRKVVSYIENSDTDPVDEDIENENVPAKPARKALRVKASPVDSDPDINAVGKTTRQSDRAPKSMDVGVFEAFRYVKNAPAESKFSAPQSIADLVRTAAVRNPAKAVPAHAASSIPNSNNKSRSHEKGKSKPQKSRVDNVRRSSRDAGAKVNYKLQESGDSDSDVQVVEPRGRAAAVKSRRSQPSGTASFDEESEDEEGEESDEVSEPEMESESDVKPVTKKSARARKGASDDDDDDSSNDDDQSDESDDQGDVEEVEPLESIEKLIGHQKVDGVDQFLIKFKNMSYMHNRWMTADDLISQFEGSRLRISRFLTKEAAGELDADYYTSGEFFNPEYLQIDRIIAHDVCEESSDEESDSDLPIPTSTSAALEHFDPAVYAGMQFLVKWKSLSYSDVTWERYSSIRAFPEAIVQYFKRQELPRSSGTTHLRGRVLPPHFEESPAYRNENALRSYQLEGLNWLAFNYSQGRNVILADEMGLGKTVQCISFLNWLVFSNDCIGPFIVIAPLSTLPHWQREVEAWTHLNSILYHGDQNARDIICEFETHYRNERNVKIRKPLKFHVLLTTPEMAIADEEFLSKISWEVLICDEAQRLKNRQSRLFTTLENFSFQHTVLLSGTPLQNNIGELFALLSFIDRNHFCDFDAFMKQYGNMSDAKQVEQLQEEIRPYMLRRLKGDVEKSLPGKEETLVEVELTMLQKKYYKAVFEKNSVQLQNMAGSKALPSLMNIAMQLRKTCNHPFTLEGVEENELSGCTSHADSVEKLIASSGKLVLLDKLLPRLKEQGHKVLIFSQMVKILDILEDYANARGFGCERIDGGVKGSERQAGIDRFSRKDSDKFLFLLCTKAGGVGINLTAADTVIIYDSDWNPQNDLQATARCHRIGQTKPVKIYRLITRGTYEQEMFTRASMKLGLDRAVLQTMAMVATDGGSSKAKPSLSAKEVESLLRHGAYAAFEEDDKRIEQFQADDIEQILSRSTTIVHDNGAPSEGASNFSKAAFVANKLEAQVNLDDPNFWQKLMPNQGNFGDVNINEFSFKRSRKTVLPPQKGAQRRIQSESVEDSDVDDRGSDASVSDSEVSDSESGDKQKNRIKLDDSVPESSAWTAGRRDVVLNVLHTRGYGQWTATQKALAQYDALLQNSASADVARFTTWSPSGGPLSLYSNLSDNAFPDIPADAVLQDVQSIRMLVLSFIAEVIESLDSNLIVRCLLASIRRDVVEALFDLVLQSSVQTVSTQYSSRSAASTSQNLMEAQHRIENEASIWELLKQIPRHSCLQTPFMRQSISNSKPLLQDVERVMAIRALHATGEKLSSPSKQKTCAAFMHVIDANTADFIPGQWWGDPDDHEFMVGVSRFGLRWDLVAADSSLHFRNVKAMDGDSSDEEYSFPAFSALRRRFVSLAAVAIQDWRKLISAEVDALGGVSSGSGGKRKRSDEQSLTVANRKSIEKAMQLMAVPSLDQLDLWQRFASLAQCEGKDVRLIQQYVSDTTSWALQLVARSDEPQKHPDGVIQLSSAKTASALLARQELLRKVASYGDLVAIRVEGDTHFSVLDTQLSNHPKTAKVVKALGQWNIGPSDRALISGVNRYGFGSWNAMHEDSGIALFANSTSVAQNSPNVDDIPPAASSPENPSSSALSAIVVPKDSVLEQRICLILEAFSDIAQNPSQYSKSVQTKISAKATKTSRKSDVKSQSTQPPAESLKSVSPSNITNEGREIVDIDEIPSQKRLKMSPAKDVPFEVQSRPDVGNCSIKVDDVNEKLLSEPNPAPPSVKKSMNQVPMKQSSLMGFLTKK